MKRKVYLQIPEPCTENWNAMTPVEQGRHCDSCKKDVVDFTEMTDKEILKVLSKKDGHTCGRFITTQLENPIVEEVAPALKPYKFFLSAFMPAFLFAAKATSQDLKGKVRMVNERPVPPPPSLVVGVILEAISPSISGSITLPNGEPASSAIVKIKDTQASVKADKYGRFSMVFPKDKSKLILQVQAAGCDKREVEVNKAKLKTLHIKLSKTNEQPRMLVGDVATICIDHISAATVADKLLTGKVINQNGEPLPNASIKVAATNQTIVSDSAGKFSIPKNVSHPSIELTTSCIGYETVVTAVSANRNEVTIVMKNYVKLGEVVVASYPLTSCTSMLGGVSMVRKVTVVDTVSRFVAKVFKNEMFNVFPNPVSKASNINIMFKDNGAYTIQIIDNAGKLYVTKQIKVDAKQASSIELPSNLTNGMYYIKAVNSSSGKQYVDKMIVQ